jgi:plasmid stabilization system protein ParE
MRYHIIWSPKARITYLGILEYLEENWTLREMENFIKRTDEVISHISQNPLLYQYSGSNDIYKCVMIKQVSLFYQIKGKNVELLLFWITGKIL